MEAHPVALDIGFCFALHQSARVLCCEPMCALKIDQGNYFHEIKNTSREYAAM